jgi:hypothetical protein
VDGRALAHYLREQFEVTAALDAVYAHEASTLDGPLAA